METSKESSIIREKTLKKEKKDIEIALKRSKDNDSNYVTEEELRKRQKIEEGG